MRMKNKAYKFNFIQELYIEVKTLLYFILTALYPLHIPNFPFVFKFWNLFLLGFGINWDSQSGLANTAKKQKSVAQHNYPIL